MFFFSVVGNFVVKVVVGNKNVLIKALFCWRNFVIIVIDLVQDLACDFTVWL